MHGYIISKKRITFSIDILLIFWKKCNTRRYKGNVGIKLSRKNRFTDCLRQFQHNAPSEKKEWMMFTNRNKRSLKTFRILNGFGPAK